MVEINQEEYEVLKGLDDKWKWIARNWSGFLHAYDTKPTKNIATSHWENFVGQTKRLDGKFQFIQWEDESPYNIQELIEEYEEHEFYDYVGWEHHKKKKSEVKNIEWLKREIHKELEGWHGVEGGIDGDGINEIMLLINQLDEPEVLSHKWIDEHKKRKFFDFDEYRTEVILVEDLQNLLVPKRHKEETNTLHDGEIRLQIGFDGSTETSYATSVGEALEILTDYDSSYHVIEKPTVPQFVADWHVQNKYYLLGAKFERIADWEDKRVVDWYRQCSGRHNNKLSNAQETIALMDLVGYEVEEEQRYYLKIGNLYLAEPLGDMTSDIVRMTRDKRVAYQFTDEKSIATHLDKFEGTEAVKVEELEE